MEGLFNWVLDMTYEVAKMGSFLTTKIPNTDFTPLTILSVAGITFLLGWKIVRLVVGG